MDCAVIWIISRHVSKGKIGPLIATISSDKLEKVARGYSICTQYLRGFSHGFDRQMAAHRP